MFFTIFGAIVISLLVYYFFFNNRRNVGPFNIPGFGILPILIWNGFTKPNKRTFHLLHEMSEKYGPVTSYNLGMQPYVIISGYNVIKDALINHADVFSGRPQNPFYHVLAKHRGIIFSEGPLWQEHKRFSLRVLKDFGFGRSTSEEQIKIEAQELVKTLHNNCNKWVDVKNIFAKAVVNVIAQMVFNERTGYEDKSFDEFLAKIVHVTQVSLSTLIVMFYPFLCNPYIMSLDSSSKKLIDAEEWIMNVCQEKINAIRKQFIPDSEPNCYIEAYFQEVHRLEFKENVKMHTFDNDQLIRTVFDLYIAGTDTTTHTLRWLLLYASLHPEFQENVFKEIEQVIGTDREVSMSDKKECNYIQAFIDESQRISTLVPNSVDHRVIKDYEFQGCVIPDNAIVLINIYGVHRDPHVFPNPNKFNPDNFLDSNGKYRMREEFMPFGIGKRSCLGEMLARMELFIFFTTLVQHFRFELSADSIEHVEDILLGTEGIVHAPGDYLLNSFPRSV